MDNSAKHKKYWREQIKARGVQALGGKCAICGGVFEDCCYDYHHLDASQKDFTISNVNTNGARSWLKVRDEIKKCALLCAVCHRRLHAGYVTLDNTINYFNDDYYEWDLCDAKQVDSSTGKPIPSRSRICPICGGEKSPNAEKCEKCAKTHEPRFEVTREQLKELIYTTPFTRIGEQFGVTDNAIRKRCIAYGLPSKKSEIKQYTKEQWDKI